jgi:hypothetical protein
MTKLNYSDAAVRDQNATMHGDDNPTRSDETAVTPRIREREGVSAWEKQAVRQSLRRSDREESCVRR